MRSGEDARRSRIVRLAAEGRLLVRLRNTARYRDDRGSAPTTGCANAPRAAAP